jgi:hypothetical protein
VPQRRERHQVVKRHRAAGGQRLAGVVRTEAQALHPGRGGCTDTMQRVFDDDAGARRHVSGCQEEKIRRGLSTPAASDHVLRAMQPVTDKWQQPGAAKLRLHLEMRGIRCHPPRQAHGVQRFKHAARPRHRLDLARHGRSNFRNQGAYPSTRQVSP